MFFYDNIWNNCNCQNRCNYFSNGSFYSLFVGLNDKCEKRQLISTEQALEIVQDVCKKYFNNGFTILVGTGADRGSSCGIENSIYIMAINASEQCAIQVASILQREFNINEVLIEKNQTRYLYYKN